uniref:Uncharacterized protein n=1 Tax=Anguilla anguilla TaxID=7936 RepID=A0A0E9UXU3_ANGAN
MEHARYSETCLKPHMENSSQYFSKEDLLNASRCISMISLDV